MEIIKYYVILVTLTMIGAFGAYFFKKSTAYISNFRDLLLQPSFYFGGGLYFVSALMNIYVLKYLPYTLVLPLTSITYIWTMLISYILLKEKVTKYKKIGVVLICFGALLIGIS